MDPDSFNPDRDTDSDSALQVNADTDPDLIRIQGIEDQKLKKKNTAENFVDLF